MCLLCQKMRKGMIARLKSYHVLFAMGIPCRTANNGKGTFIHSGHLYSASSSPLLLRGAPEYSTDTVSEFNAEAHSAVLTP